MAPQGGVLDRVKGDNNFKRVPHDQWAVPWGVIHDTSLAEAREATADLQESVT